MNFMIETIKKGDILKADAEALVNTVNCVGVMGRGIALQFKKKFPENFDAYKKVCDSNELKLGRVFVFDMGQMFNPRYIVNFPTKDHWRSKSKIEAVKAGLVDLVHEVEAKNIKSIAIPPLGCGLGGLSWAAVRPLIESAFENLDVRVLVYEPGKAPAANTMAKASQVPKMTVGRAALLGLMNQYLSAVMDPFVSLLELHKLMYFMQEMGEPLRLKFKQAAYGPYAENLRHVLNAIEGHFITGFGDGADDPTKAIEVNNGAIDSAQELLNSSEDTKQRFEAGSDLINGFETPFGMELLATVHWVATHGAETVEQAVEQVHAWNTRKKKLFNAAHIELAWNNLRQHKLLPS